MTDMQSPREQQKPQPVEEKKTFAPKSNTFDFLIPESRKLIRQGNYKKAFRMLDQYFGEPKKLGTINKMKACRRIMASIVTMCAKQISEPEIRKQDNIQKLLDAGTNYLIHWHNAISNYIVKTNKKFEHFHGLLDEISNSSDDESASRNDSRSRRSSHRDSTRMQTPAQGSAAKSGHKHDRQASLLVQILKNQDNRDGTSDNILDNSFNDVDGSNIMMEEFTGDEINTSFQLDEFFGYYILHMINYGSFYKRMKMFSSAFRYLEFSYRLTKQLESTLNPNLLNICAKGRIPLGVFYLEFGKHREAQEVLDSTINILQVELSVRSNRNNERREEEEFIIKVRKTVKLLCTTLITMAKNYELQFQYARLLESYKVAFWFAKKYLPTEDDFYKMVSKLYEKGVKEYADHLEEVGEMERVVFENKEITDETGEKQESNRNDHFDKLQDHLYKKFNYIELNKLQLPVRTAPKTMQSKRNTKSELFDNKFDPRDEFAEKFSESSGVKNPIRDLMTPQYNGDSPGKSPTEFEGSPTRGSTPHGQTKRRKDKNNLKKIAGKHTTNEKKLISMEGFNLDKSTEKLIDKMEVDEDEEQRYIQQLNRNIKTKRPRTASSMGSFKSMATKSTATGFIDIDDFFANRIDGVIKIEGEDKVKPQDFSRVVKNYIFHRKNEDFDKKQVHFCSKMLQYKGNEDLGNFKGAVKDLPLAGLLREKRSVDTDGYFVQTQTQVENTIQARLNISKTLNSRSTPRVKKFYTPMSSTLPNQVPSVPEIEETKTDEPGADKLKLSSILFKHKNELRLRTVANVVRDTHKRTQSEAVINTQDLLKQNEGEVDVIEDRFQVEEWKKMGTMVKDRITGMMEGIERELRDDAIITGRIKQNKSIFQERKQKDKFLKGLEELSNSCRLLSIKKDAKTLDFADIVRISKLKADEKKKEKLRKRTTILAINRPSFSSELGFQPAKKTLT